MNHYQSGQGRSHIGKEFQNAEVEHKTGGKLDASYIGKLRNGRVDNPTLNTMMTLANAFGVEPDYFLRREPVQQEGGMDQVRVALRSSGLNREAQQYLEQLIQALRKGNETQ